jgi:hypothetical protein
MLLVQFEEQTIKISSTQLESKTFINSVRFEAGVN